MSRVRAQRTKETVWRHRWDRRAPRCRSLVQRTQRNYVHPVITAPGTMTTLFGTRAPRCRISVVRALRNYAYPVITTPGTTTTPSGTRTPRCRTPVVRAQRINSEINSHFVTRMSGISTTPLGIHQASMVSDKRIRAGRTNGVTVRWGHRPKRAYRANSNMPTSQASMVSEMK